MTDLKKRSGGFTRTPSLHCRGTLEQCTETAVNHIGPCDELVTDPGVDPAFTHLCSVKVARFFLPLAQQTSQVS